MIMRKILYSQLPRDPRLLAIFHAVTINFRRGDPKEESKSNGILFCLSSFHFIESVILATISKLFRIETNHDNILIICSGRNNNEFTHLFLVLLAIHFPHNDNTNYSMCHCALHYDWEMPSQSRVFRCLFGGRQNRWRGSQRVRGRNTSPYVRQRFRLRLNGSVQRRSIIVVLFAKNPLLQAYLEQHGVLGECLSLEVFGTLSDEAKEAIKGYEIFWYKIWLQPCHWFEIIVQEKQ